MMRLFIFLTVYLFSLQAFSQSAPPDSVSDASEVPVFYLNEAERELFSAINAYRKQHRLEAIPLSISLSQVARYHVYDLASHYRYGSNCNLHSWSSDSRWSSCCYTNDHRQPSCMWDKPRELTSYTGDGYEIAFFSNEDFASVSDFIEGALKGWKSSRGHHDLIINRGKWATAHWKALGVGVYNGFAVVWFGELPDLSPIPTRFTDY